LQQAPAIVTHAPPGSAVQSVSNRQPPVKHRAAFRPSVPAGAQIALAPEQSSALLHALEAHTGNIGMAGPPQNGSMGPSTHLPGGPASVLQSELLQHCPCAMGQSFTSGTLTAHTR
jgi:hypothetical protein